MLGCPGRFSFALNRAGDRAVTRRGLLTTDTFGFFPARDMGNVGPNAPQMELASLGALVGVFRR